MNSKKAIHSHCPYCVLFKRGMTLGPDVICFNLSQVLSTTQDTQIGAEQKNDAFKNKIYFNMSHACSLVIKPNLVFDNTAVNERGQTNIFGKRF